MTITTLRLSIFFLFCFIQFSIDLCCADPPSTAQVSIRIKDGGSYTTVVAFGKPNGVLTPMTYPFWQSTGATCPACNATVPHKTNYNPPPTGSPPNTLGTGSKPFQHGHVTWALPAYFINGNEIPVQDIKDGWINFYTARYWKDNFTSSGEPDIKFNCHSFSTDSTDIWNDLKPTYLTDGYELVDAHKDAQIFTMTPDSTWDGCAHSVKKDSFVEAPSGKKTLTTLEKFRESQIFRKNWLIDNDASDPGGTSGSKFAGRKYKRK